MLDYIKKEANLARTENNSVTYRSTGSDCLDFFATAGAIRKASDDEIIARFVRAYMEDPDSAMKLLFYTRDVRGGLGERRVFRTAIKWLADNRPDSVRKNIRYFAEYGRFDDLLALMGTACEDDMFAELKRCFDRDMESLSNDGEVSLLAKWLPSVNASSRDTVRTAKRIARRFGMDDASYRKTLTELRARIRVIENNLRVKDYSFDYGKQPSRAMLKYRKAFIRNDRERYAAFLSTVSAGEAKIHANTIAPYELVEPFIGDGNYSERSFMRAISQEEKDSLNAAWASLPDYGSDDNALAVIDTSGSMYWQNSPLPASVALSLGLYFAERNKGAFGNHFIEFSRKPQLIEIKGKTFADKLRYVASFNEVANTNLEAVFDLILNAAAKNNVPQNELPERLIIISDMEFDLCINNANKTVFEDAKDKYEKHGYTLPQVVFWNVASRHRHQPVRKDERGVIMVSGATPMLFSMVADGTATPYSFMMDILNSKRYENITA